MKLDNITVAFIDLDGTLIKDQSQRLLILYLRKKGFISRTKSLIIITWFLMYKLGIAKDTRRVLKFALSAFKNSSAQDIELQMDEFVSKYIVPKFRRHSKELIEYLNEKGIKTVIFSAAVDLIVGPVSKILNAKTYTSTNIEIVKGKFTGNILGIQNHGTNKVKRLEQYCEMNNIAMDTTLSIADHESDLELLLHTKFGIVANPDKKMHSLASKYNLPMIYLDTDEPVQYFESNTLSK